MIRPSRAFLLVFCLWLTWMPVGVMGQVTVPDTVIEAIGDSLLSRSWHSKDSARNAKRYRRDSLRRSKIANGKLMWTPYIAPGYTPELNFHFLVGSLFSFRTQPHDSTLHRSSFAVTGGLSINGAYFANSLLKSYWLGGKLRINLPIFFKNMPDHYWGVGIDDALRFEKGDTTSYLREWISLNLQAEYMVVKDLFLGIDIDYNQTKAITQSLTMEADSYYQLFGSNVRNLGVGAILSYDSRDIPENAWSGMLLRGSATFYSRTLGSDFDYAIYRLDYRQYLQLGRPGSTLAWQVSGRFGTGDVPWAELSQLGTPWDLRGYYWGRFRDKFMLFGIAEYRHTFIRSSGKLRKHGFVLWVGTGSLAHEFPEFRQWLPNVGIGYRFELQPRMNIRLDIGFGKKSSAFYGNFNEAF